MIMAYAEYGRKRLRIGSLTDQTLRLLRNRKPLSAGIFGCQRHSLRARRRAEVQQALQDDSRSIC
jgi:hypothetical protein